MRDHQLIMQRTISVRWFEVVECLPVTHRRYEPQGLASQGPSRPKRRVRKGRRFWQTCFFGKIRRA